MQILYNAQYGQYVLLFHADTPKFTFPAVGAAALHSKMTIACSLSSQQLYAIGRALYMPLCAAFT